MHGNDCEVFKVIWLIVSPIWQALPQADGSGTSNSKTLSYMYTYFLHPLINDNFLFYSYLEETRSSTYSLDMCKDISKFLYKCNPQRVELFHLENFDEIKEYLEACVELGLGISGLVNKLTAFIAVVDHLHSDSATLAQLVDLRKDKSSVSSLCYATTSNVSLSCFSYSNSTTAATAQLCMCLASTSAIECFFEIWCAWFSPCLADCRLVLV